jgi:hydrogenase maturation protease
MMTVIGLGNRLRGDDGIGPHVIEALTYMKNDDEFHLIDAGSDAFTVLDHLLRPQPLLLIDCALMGKEPGEIGLFPLSVEVTPAATGAISLHGYSLAEVIHLASQTGELTHGSIIGIEPQTIEFNQGLSAKVKEKVPEIIALVKKEISRYGKENTHH